MTVRDLLRQLKTHRPEAEVMIHTPGLKAIAKIEGLPSDMQGDEDFIVLTPEGFDSIADRKARCPTLPRFTPTKRISNAVAG